MRQRWYRLLAMTLLVVAVAAAAAYAGPGKISGVVTDTEGQPAAGANVVIEGTMLGAAADAEGMYFILNVPPGTYRLRASAVGYAPKVVAGVLVSEDQIVTVNFELQSEAVGLAEVVVQAERAVVDQSQTASVSRLTGDQITELPVRSSVGVIATSASAFNGYIRGGKIVETKTIVDGVDISDSYYAYEADVRHTAYRAYTNVPRYQNAEVSKISGFSFNAVEQVSINTGAVGAEYSQATAGVVSYSLREGRGPLTGSVSARVSQFNGLQYAGPDIYWNDNIYFDERNALSRRVDSLRALRATGGSTPTLANDSTRLGFYTYSKDKYINETPQYEFDVSLSGDITKDWGFFFSGSYFDSHGRLPNEFSRTLGLSLKTQYNFTGDIKLTALGILTDRGQLFGWKNRGYNENARFFLEGTPRNNGLDLVASLRLTHVLSPQSYYEVQASLTQTEATTGYTGSVNSSGLGTVDPEGDEWITLETLAEGNAFISNSDLSRFFRNQDEPVSSTNYFFVANNTTARLARPGFYYEDFMQRTITVKGDYTNQITDNHRLQGGLQVRFGELDMLRRASYLGAIDTRKQFYTETWNPKPFELGAYIQDRMEYAGLIINVGLRVDTWDPGAEDFANYFAPYIVGPVQVDTVPGVPVTVDDRIAVRGRAVDPYVFISPRIGVSHPISDVAAMYFSYSRNSQPPPYSRLYANYNNFGNISLPNNPSLRQKPFSSNNYELGVQWEFMEGVGLDFTAYLRDIENYGYAGFTVVPRSSVAQTYGIGFSSGYADSRGIETTLRTQRRRLFDFVDLTAQVTYAFSYVKASANAGLSGDQTTTFSTNADSARLQGDLPFDDYEFYNKIQRNVLNAGSTLLGGYDREHRIGYQVIMGFPLDFTFSFVGSHQSGFYFARTQTDDPRIAGRDFGTGPWNHQVDARLEKGFSFAGVRAAIYVDVENLFNWVNIISYDNATNDGQVDWEESVEEGEPYPAGPKDRPVGLDGTYFYGVPRGYYFGLRLNF